MSGVFGNPITNETLEGLPEYDGKQKIEAADRASVAMKWMNAENKDLKAIEYVEKMRAITGRDDVAVAVLIYNGTGNTLKYLQHRHWNGNLGPCPFPSIIYNGQWGAFLYSPSTGSQKSSAGFVYRGKNDDNTVMDWMLSWRTTRSQYINHAYTEVWQKDHFNEGAWAAINGYLDQTGNQNERVQSSYENNGYFTQISIGDENYSICRAIFTLTNVY